MVFHYNRRKAIVCYAKSLRLKRKLNERLNISPCVSQYEQWEKEVKAFPNIKALREYGKTHKLYTYMLYGNVDRGYITRRMWEESYINYYVLRHVANQLDSIEFQDHLFIVGNLE